MPNKLNFKNVISQIKYDLIPKIVKIFLIGTQLVILAYFGINMYLFNKEYIKIFGYLKQLHNYINTSEVIAAHYFRFILCNTLFIIVFLFFIFLQISYIEDKRLEE